MFSCLGNVDLMFVRGLPRRCLLVTVIVLGSELVIKADEPCRPYLPERLQIPAIIQKAEQVSGILDELSKSRERFLESGDLIELFPTLYYHTTVAQFREALSQEPQMAGELLDLIIAFYDAYLSNRQRFDSSGAKAAEAHWKAYYQRATEQNRAKTVDTPTILAILLYGVDAHLTDLARSIRYSLTRNRVTVEEFRNVYFKLDPIFYPVAAAANNDISAGRKLDERIMGFENTFGLGARYVIMERDKAWKEATASGPLRAAAPQPVLPLKKGSTTFFTIKKTEPCQKPS